MNLEGYIFFSERGLDGYQGLGAAAPFDLMAQADAMLTPLPAPLIAAIDKAPMSIGQKSKLKRHPTSFFVVYADWNRWLLVKFIQRVQSMANRSNRYKISGTVVRIAPTMSTNPFDLAAQFLTVVNRNPVLAMQVAGTMGGEIAAQSAMAAGAGMAKALEPINEAADRAAASVGLPTSNQLTSVAVKASKDAKKQAELIAAAAGKSLDDVVEAGNKAANDTAKSLTSWFTGFGDYLIPESISSVLGGLGIKSVGDFVAAVISAISLAEVLVGPIVSIGKGQQPQQPSVANVNAAIQDSSELEENAADAGVELDKTIFGIPQTWVIGGGVVAGVGTLAWYLTKKKR